jgi:predicted MFS family arabinose efflux permease
VFKGVVVARAIRSAAYGSLSVILAVTLAKRGLDPASVGTVLTLALVGGAALSFSTGAIVARLGRRTTLVGAALSMTASGLLLAMGKHPAAFGVAALLGTLSPSGQDVGPFGAIEQAAIAEDFGASATRRFATYNIVSSSASALGALAVVATPVQWLLYGYAAVGIALAAIYALIFRHPDGASASREAKRPPAPRRSFGVAERLSLLFGLDALAGGFVVQSFIAYWLFLRFGVDQRTLGALFFATGLLSALSFPLAAVLAERFGLLETMVFTHLPSNVLLLVVPLMPTFPLAAGVLLARFALSQMDVPTRQAYTMTMVPPGDRTRAAGLTNATRPAAAAVAPALSGLAIQGATFGLPFFLAGGLKIVYDLILFATFRRMSAPLVDGEEAGDRLRL